MTCPVVRSIDDLSWVATLNTADIPKALVQVSALQSALAARLVGAESRASVSSELLDAPALARRMGVCVSQIYAMARADEIPHVKVGRYVRFDECAVRTALEVRS